jgi:hypothetical protein
MVMVLIVPQDGTMRQRVAAMPVNALTDALAPLGWLPSKNITKRKHPWLA